MRFGHFSLDHPARRQALQLSLEGPPQQGLEQVLRPGARIQKVEEEGVNAGL
jgi:hypothetical protein